MTDEKYTIEQIDEKIRQAWLSVSARKGRAPKLSELSDELRTPKFEEGQLYSYRTKTGGIDIGEAGENGELADPDHHDCKPLTQAFVGSGWVPRDKAMKVLDVTKQILFLFNRNMKVNQDSPLHKKLSKAITDFDRATGESDE